MIEHNRHGKRECCSGETKYNDPLMVLPAGDVFQVEVEEDRLLQKLAGVHAGLLLGQVGGEVEGHIVEEVVRDIKHSIAGLQLHESRY